jgi:hypothetical protein
MFRKRRWLADESTAHLNPRPNEGADAGRCVASFAVVTGKCHIRLDGFVHPIARYISLAALACGLPFASSGHAGPLLPSPGGATDLVVSAGNFDIGEANSTPAIGLEIRNDVGWYGVGPAVGMLFTGHRGVYVHGGFHAEMGTRRIRVHGHLALGGYARGDGKDLGGAFEFREAIGLAYRASDEVQIGVQFAHISNGDIFDHNPGVEDLQLMISIPLREAW